MKKLAATLLIAPLFGAQPCFAADDPPAIAGDEQAYYAVQEAPNSETLGLTSVPHLELHIDQDKQDVSFNVSLVTSHSRRAEDSAVIKSDFDQLTLTAQTTLGKDKKQKTILRPKGFGDGTSIELRYTHFWQQIADPTTYQKAQQDAYAIAVANCRSQNAATLEPKVLEKTCSKQNGGLGNFMSIYNPDGFKATRARVFARAATPFAGLSFNGNQTKYNYLDRPTFTLLDTSRFGYEASLFGGLMFRDTPLIVRGSLTFAKKYDEADPVNLCQATTVPGQTMCLSGADGAPQKAEQRTVSLQTYWALAPDSEGAPRFGIAPSGSYDWKNKTWQIDFPIYLARNKDKQLSGGVMASYINAPDAAGGRKGDFTIGVFIGLPLGWGF